GIGKTTLVRKVCDKLGEQTKPKGFYTEEVRVNGQRIGFDVVSFGGTRGILAREQTTDNVRRPKVGKYSVYVQDFEQLALPLLKSAPLLVIDEIGKMELLSQRFEAAVNELLQKEQFMLATIPSQTRQPIALVERLKKAPHAVIYEVTNANRNALVNAIAEQILETNH
ncbi:CG10581, partial [Drosophila busckii]